jgi:hypothetical protein
MLSPIDLVINDLENANIDLLIEKIDESIKRFHGWYPWESALIEDELPLVVRNEIAQAYKDAGWKYVEHQTSSENDERPGLTSFRLSMEPLQYHLKHIC